MGHGLSPKEIKPVLVLSDGRQFTGKSHLHAYKKLKRSRKPSGDTIKEMFKHTKSGRLLTQEEAAAETGLETKVEPGRLHSGDMP